MRAMTLYSGSCVSCTSATCPITFCSGVTILLLSRSPIKNFVTAFFTCAHSLEPSVEYSVQSIFLIALPSTPLPYLATSGLVQIPQLRSEECAAQIGRAVTVETAHAGVRQRDQRGPGDR